MKEKWPRAICSMCGYSYRRNIWRWRVKSGQLGCSVRTCTGKLWIVPNETTGWAMNALDREQRARHAKLYIIGEVIDS